MIWFGHLERTVKHYKLIHVALDDHIPFCEVFIVPYLLWFLYVAVTVMYFFFKDKDDYFKCCTFLFTGMTVFLLVSTLWPSIHVYNSLGCHFAIAKSRHFAQHKGIRFGSLVLCVSIILSTMFTKQHSVFDVMTALIMASIMYLIVYHSDVLLNLKHNLNRKNKRKMGPETL